MPVPQGRGRAAPYRSQLWSTGANTSEVLKRLIVEMEVGGRSPREMEYGREKALGQFVLATSAGSELPARLTQEDEAFRTRALGGSEVACLLIAAVYEPVRRGGSKTGVRGVGAICVDGRKVLLSLSTANRARQESCLAVVRDLWKRGVQTPVPMTSDGAVGLTKAGDASWPKSRRSRGWLHRMQNLQEQVPPQAWPEVNALGLARRDAPRVAEAERRRHELGKREQLDFPEAWRCLLAEAQASLKHRHVPQRHQPYVRPSSLAERACEEERRRTTVIPQLWEEGGLVKLVFAVVIRVSERWGKKCVSEFEHQQIRSLRQRLKLDEQEVSMPNPTGEPQPRRSAASAA